MSETIKEYKDKAGEWRINQTAVNGNITDATSEGYKNRKDARTNRINASIAYLKHYKLNKEQKEELLTVLKNKNVAEGMQELQECIKKASLNKITDVDEHLDYIKGYTTKEDYKAFFIYFATNGENFEGKSIEFLVDEYLTQE